MKRSLAHTLNVQADAEAKQEKLITTLSPMGVEFGERINNFSKVTTAGITIYDHEKNERLRFLGTNIKNCMYVHDSYLYCLADPVPTSPTIVDVTGEAPPLVPNHKYRAAGFYVYDMSQMMEGKLESYRLYPSIVGVNTLLDNSRFSDRFSFLSDFNHILVIPFPHMNLLNFIGMG
jgi:hypothetical protein